MERRKQKEQEGRDGVGLGLLHLFKWISESIPIGRSGESSPISIIAYLGSEIKLTIVTHSKHK